MKFQVMITGYNISREDISTFDPYILVGEVEAADRFELNKMIDKAVRPFGLYREPYSLDWSVRFIGNTHAKFTHVYVQQITP